MKIITLSSALAAILGLALACAPVTSHAQSTNAPSATTATGTTTPSKKKSKYTQYAGTLKALSAASATVTTKTGDITLTIDSTTNFHVNKKKAASTDFAVGDSVTGSYAKNADGTLTAHSLNKKKS